MLQRWAKAIGVYFDKRMFTMLLLGFASGFPYLLVFGTFSLWLKDAGVSLAAIGLFSLAKAPYSFKWAWSPLVDRVRLPLFSRLGRRRGWALFSQICLMITIWAMAITDPVQSPVNMAIFTFLTVVASATQDIVLDAYRIESFSTREQGAGVAVFVLGYRFGLLFSGAGALFMASLMAWEDVYKVMALTTVVGMVTVFLAPKVAQELEKAKSKQKRKFMVRLKDFIAKSVVSPFADFMQRPSWFLILMFVFLYRMADAYMAPMAYPFFDDMGFTKVEIAMAYKVVGVIATIIGSLVGGVLVSRYGLVRSLFVCGVLQGLTNLSYVWQANVGHDISVLVVAISLDNLSAGMGTAAFVAYLSSLCNKEYTATQYALLSSFMSLARDVFAATSGFLALAVSWQIFFTISAVMVIPPLILLAYMVKIKAIRG